MRERFNLEGSKSKSRIQNYEVEKQNNEIDQTWSSNLLWLDFCYPHTTHDSLTPED